MVFDRGSAIGAMQPSACLASNDRFASHEGPFVIGVAAGRSCPQPAPHGRPEENLRFDGKPAFPICLPCEAQAFKPDIRVLKPRHPIG